MASISAGGLVVTGKKRARHYSLRCFLALTAYERWEDKLTDRGGDR